MLCIYNCYLYSDTFERGQEKLRMAENISDINTEDEENMKQTRHNRAAAKFYTSDDESSGTELNFSLLPPLPDPKEFSVSQQQLHSEKPVQILATYEQPSISCNKIQIFESEKKKRKIVEQERDVMMKHKKKELEDKRYEDANYSIDANSEELRHLSNDEDQSQKG